MEADDAEGPGRGESGKGPREGSDLPAAEELIHATLHIGLEGTALLRKRSMVEKD